MRIGVGQSRSDGSDEERSMSVEDMNAILPEMNFSHEGWRKQHPHITADREGGAVVGMNVKDEGGNCFHDDDVVGCVVSLSV